MRRVFLVNCEGIWVALKLALEISFKMSPTKTFILYIFILLLVAWLMVHNRIEYGTICGLVDLSGVWSCWELKAPYLHCFLTCTAVASCFLFIWKNGDLEIYIIWSTVCTNRISDANFHLFANQRFWKGNVSVLLITLKYILFMR